MKLIVTLLVVVCVVATYAKPADEKYTTKFDNIKISDILESDRLRNNYIQCLLGEGKCTPDGSELKRNLSDALETGCSKCSEKQREGSMQVISFLVNEKPEEWEKLSKVYDKDGKYKQRYENEYKKVKKTK